LFGGLGENIMLKVLCFIPQVTYSSAPELMNPVCERHHHSINPLRHCF
jgi:hypothetical protein